MNRKVNKITIEILTNSHLNEHVNDMQVKFEKVKNFCSTVFYETLYL